MQPCVWHSYIFVVYHMNVTNLCYDQLRDRLRMVGYRVWVALDQPKESLLTTHLEAMATKAVAVISCISWSYVRSTLARAGER